MFDCSKKIILIAPIEVLIINVNNRKPNWLLVYKYI